jgi:hypothetical protein
MIAPTREEIVANVVTQANRNGRKWTADQLCWCGMALDLHVERGATGFMVAEHAAGAPPVAPVSVWDPWSVPSSWCAL